MVHPVNRPCTLSGGSTFSFFMSCTSSNTFSVPATLVLMAMRNFSSKRTVAAPWNTKLTSSVSRLRSEGISPKPGILQSPDMAATLCRNFGIWSCRFPNNCNSRDRSLSKTTWYQHCRKGYKTKRCSNSKLFVTPMYLIKKLVIFIQ